jgi:hypothetical protein
MTIYLDSFQPFASRQGVDSVLRLRFQFDRGLVELLKRSLRVARPLAAPQKHCGGWQRSGLRLFPGEPVRTTA